MKFKIVLSKRGEEIFKGGNIEVMQKPLRKFTAKSQREAEHKFNEIITIEVGSASFGNYELKEDKNEKGNKGRIRRISVQRD
jgi:hypothetical protein